MNDYTHRSTAHTPARASLRAAHRRRALFSLCALLFLFLITGDARGATERVIVIKVDGLPPALVERYVKERDPRTGKSRLPWFNHVFYERGTRVPNFYVRGMSLSAPSWSLLDTGRHLQLKGNVEYDRFTLHAYDYLNFLPFYVAAAREIRVDMPGTEVLDDLRIPLLYDAFRYEARYPSFQLLQRGVRWTTLRDAATNRVTSRTPRELFDEWTLGFEARIILPEQQERELLDRLSDTSIRYFDYYSTEFDHVAHGNPDPTAQFHVIQDVDALIGRIWTGIQASPMHDETALVLVSDHGINSVPGIYSQGFNLVKLLGSAEGGGHHVVTKRRLMLDYAIKGINPFVPLVTSTSENSPYLKGQSTDYPTALLDFDGNERASIHLRDADLNELHVLLQQLKSGKLATAVERAATEAFFKIINRNRDLWRRTLVELEEELRALRREIARRQSLIPEQKPQWTREELRTGVNKEVVREAAAVRRMIADEERYSDYTRSLARLLELQQANFDASQIKIADIIPRNSMGDANTLHKLQNYTVGLSQRGLTLAPNGALDEAQSFHRVNYFALLHSQTVRNNVQRGVSNRPIDFVGVRVPVESWREFASRTEAFDDIVADEIVWLYGGQFRQALVLGRHNAQGELELRYLPIQQLTQDAEGRLRFTPSPWTDGLPLKIWEDAKLRISGDNAHQSARERWLSGWHTDTEWLRATHETFYSNAIVGIHEQFAIHPIESLDASAPNLSNDERLMRRLRFRQRRLVETDLFVHANDHWNFDVRGFNPGGNHGSFYRISTHSTLMFAGGAQTGIKRGHVVAEPYDSLSFVPTVLALTNKLDSPANVPVIWRKSIGSLPGRVISDLVESPAPSQTVAGASAAP